MQLPATLERPLQAVRIDFAPRHRHPKPAGVVVATLAAVVGSLVADALLVVIGEAVFPSTRGYVHFAFSDYAKLTVIGVLVAGAAWPVVSRMSSSPRWVFTRMAVAVSAVLLLPDLGILVLGQPPRAVLVLVAMHLAIGLVTYQALVRLAPVRPVRARRDRRVRAEAW